jgi:hypothetical protein
MGGTNPTDYDEHSLLASLLETVSHQFKPAILELPKDRDQMTLKSCRMLMNADVVYNYSGCDFVKSLMRREAEYLGLDPLMLMERRDDRNRNVVVCVSAAMPEVWRKVIDVSAVQDYRQLP